MKLSCEVVGDLLPLVAENMASAESAALVKEHLADCPDCRTKMQMLREPEVEPEQKPDGEAALRAVKKELRRRRLRTAAIAALLVFLSLFTLYAYRAELKPLSLEESGVRVDGVKEYGLEFSFGNRVRNFDDVSCEFVKDPESGETTLLIQAWDNERYTPDDEDIPDLSVVIGSMPDRVIYGFGGEQTLIYGEAMNGGVMVLPRLVLAYYIVIALALTAISGLLWLLLRRKKAGAVFRAICFAGLSYPIGHLLVKGIQTASFHLPRDLGMILIASAAVFALLMLLRQKRKEE